MDSLLGVQWSDIAKVAAGSVVTLLLAGLRTRRSRLRWKAFHRPLGTSLNNPAVGQISVTFNGTPMTNLVLSTVRLENDYLRDFKGLLVRVNIWAGHEILRDEARREGEAALIPWSTRFNDAVDIAVHAGPGTPNPLAGIATWREYQVPVLNRGQTLEISLLVHAVPPAAATCGLEVEAPDTVLVFQGSKVPHLLGVHLAYALVWSALLLFPLALLVLRFVPQPWQPLCLVLLGTLATGIGVLPVLAYRWVRNRLV